MSVYPIIFQISPPRSGSTAMLRCFESIRFVDGGRFQIYHEPSVRPYELKTRWGLTYFLFNSNSRTNTFRQLEQELLQTSKYSPVYVKDMAFSTFEWLSQSSLVKNPRVHFIFLLRDPYDQLVSLSKQFRTMKVPLKLVRNVYDYEILERLIGHCRRLAFHRTLVIEAECLSVNPEEVVRRILDQSNLEVCNLELTWPPKPLSFNGESWHETKTPYYFKQWHGDAITSTSFQELPKYRRDWSQFNDKSWAQFIIKRNRDAYRRMLTCVCPYYT